MGSATIRSVKKRSGAVAWYVIKWLVVPIMLAAIGFFIIGPRITKPHEYKPAGHLAEPQTQPVVDADERPRRTGDPKVEVSASPVHRRTNRRPRRVEVPPPSEETPPPAEGGAGNGA